MKFIELLEFDPTIARATQQATSGIGQAAQSLKGPLTVSDIQGRVEQGIDELENEIQNNPQQTFASTFKNFLEKEKDKVKVKGKIGMNYQNDRLIKNGKPNSSYIRAVLKKFYNELNNYIDQSADKATRAYYGKQKLQSFRPEV